jgi:hypothetical protein
VHCRAGALAHDAAEGARVLDSARRAVRSQLRALLTVLVL